MFNELRKILEKRLEYLELIVAKPETDSIIKQDGFTEIAIIDDMLEDLDNFNRVPMPFIEGITLH